MSTSQNHHVSATNSNITLSISIDSISTAAGSILTNDPSAAAGRHGETTAYYGNISARRAAFQTAYPNSPTHSSQPSTPSSASSVSSYDTFDELVMGEGDKKAEKAKIFDFSFKNIFVKGGHSGRKTLGGAGKDCRLM